MFGTAAEHGVNMRQERASTMTWLPVDYLMPCCVQPLLEVAAVVVAALICRVSHECLGLAPTLGDSAAVGLTASSMCDSTAHLRRSGSAASRGERYEFAVSDHLLSSKR